MRFTKDNYGPSLPRLKDEQIIKDHTTHIRNLFDRLLSLQDFVDKNMDRISELEKENVRKETKQ